MLEILMIAYQWALVLADAFHLCLITIQMYFMSFLRFFVPTPMKSISGKYVLITGAGHGIGEELGIQMARLGAKVVCCDINENTNAATCEAIRTREAGEAWAFTCDVSDKADVLRVMNRIKQEVGDIDILVNNAGIYSCKLLQDHSNEEVEKMFAVNVMSQFYTLHEWLPVFTARGSGHVVAMSSVMGIIGARNMAPYCATKFAIRGMMEALKEELRYDGKFPEIKLTSVHPFIIDTGLVKEYRIRFPRLTPVSTPAEAARLIIEGVRREEYQVAIPTRDFYLFKILNILPLTVQHVLSDFMGTYCDA